MTIQDLKTQLDNFNPETEIKLKFASIMDEDNVEVPINFIYLTPSGIVALCSNDWMC